MLSIARSKLAGLSQLIFVVLNSAGFLFGIVYNANTPNLYEGEIHSTLGWLLTTLVTIHALLSAVSSYSVAGQRSASVSGIRYQPLAQFQEAEAYRYSRDSGQGTEPPSPGNIDSNAAESGYREANAPKHEADDNYAEILLDNHKPVDETIVDRLLVRFLATDGANRVLRGVRIFCNILDRVLLILGFVAISAGVAVYGGHFVGRRFPSIAQLTHIRKGMKYLVDLRISSKAASSFGTVY
jgi:Domain of unknown function (DUF2427)